jgi:hypothetical protein
MGCLPLVRNGTTSSSTILKSCLDRSIRSSTLLGTDTYRVSLQSYGVYGLLWPSFYYANWYRRDHEFQSQVGFSNDENLVTLIQIHPIRMREYARSYLCSVSLGIDQHEA